MPEAAYSHSKIIMCRVFYANPPKQGQHAEIEENTRKRAQTRETGVISKRWKNSIHNVAKTTQRYAHHSSQHQRRPLNLTDSSAPEKSGFLQLVNS